jgi:hypothetical protein
MHDYSFDTRKKIWNENVQRKFCQESSNQPFAVPGNVKLKLLIGSQQTAAVHYKIVLQSKWFWLRKTPGTYLIKFPLLSPLSGPTGCFPILCSKSLYSTLIHYKWHDVTKDGVKCVLVHILLNNILLKILLNNFTNYGKLFRKWVKNSMSRHFVPPPSAPLY